MHKIIYIAIYTDWHNAPALWQNAGLRNIIQFLNDNHNMYMHNLGGWQTADR